MATHTQTWAKVNVPVDAGMREIVEALSAFKQLQTVESCENIHEWAWVTFVYGNYWDKPWQDLAEFVFGFLGPHLTSELGDRVRISMHVTEAGLYRAEMAVKTAAIPATVKALAKLRAEVSNQLLP